MWSEQRASREQGRARSRYLLLVGSSLRVVPVARATGPGAPGAAVQAGRVAGLALVALAYAEPRLVGLAAAPLVVGVLATPGLAELAVEVSTEPVRVALGVSVSLARVPAASYCNAQAGLTPGASGAAVLRRVSESLPLPVQCPVLCYHNATRSWHRLASALVQA